MVNGRTDPTGAFHPAERRIVSGSGIVGERRVRVDACVIGTGAGGAVAAKELAEGGMRVAMLEEGEWHEVDEMTARPREMTELLYRDAGQVTTIGQPADRAAARPRGRRHDAHQLRHLLPHAAAACSPAGATSWACTSMDPVAARAPLPQRSSASSTSPRSRPSWPARNAAVVRRGVERLGWSGDFLHRNAHGCVGSGVCAFGCPSGAKQHVGISYVPRAWEAGATTYTGARAERVEVERGRARAVDRAHRRAAGRCTWRAIS